MAKTLPPIARSVLVGSTAYRAGDIPPLKHARKITNPKNWEGGKTPDFDQYEDGVETVDGIGNSDAANAGRTGLPGFSSDGSPKQLVTEVDPQNGQLVTRTGSEGAGTGETTGTTDDTGGDDTGGDDPDDTGGDDPGTGDGNSGDGTAATTATPNTGTPAGTRPRKATKATPAANQQ